MKIRFTRTPPTEYNGYVEGEEVDLAEREARNLIGLGFAVAVRDSGSAGTLSVSNRTEIVGRDNEPQVVVEGRGANITKVRDPADDKLIQEGFDRNNDGQISDEERKEAEKSAAQNLVLQESSRTGGVEEEPKKASTRTTTKAVKAAPENK